MAKVVVPKGDLIVKKSEDLVKARYKLSPLAIKFLSTIIANLKRSDGIDEEYILQVKDFQELTGQKTKRIYELIEEALEDLLKNPLKIPLNKEQTKFLMCNWVSSAVYDTGKVCFMVDRRLKPFLIEVKEKYLKYNLENILKLRSSYIIRLYEVLKDWLEIYSRYGNKAEKIISLNELRDILEIPKSYQYGNSSGIKKRILEKAKAELAENTDIVFDYEEIKTGRKVTHLKFIIKNNLKKIKEQSNESKYFKSRKTFVALLRKNYSGNFKFFGFKKIDGKDYWLGLDKEGFVYAHPLTKGDNIDFNAIEAERIYDIWFKIAKHSFLYQEIVLEGTCLKEIFNNSKDIWLDLSNEIKELKEHSVI